MRLKDHSFTCILSHVARSESSPNDSLDKNPNNVVPPTTGFKVERPRFPQAGPFPFSLDVRTAGPRQQGPRFPQAGPFPFSGELMSPTAFTYSRVAVGVLQWRP